MISVMSKIILGIFFLFLVFMLFVSKPILLLIAVVLAFITSVTLADDIKKLNNPLRSKILSVILADTILCSMVLLFFGLGNFEGDEYGIIFTVVPLLCLVVLVISILVGIIRVYRNIDSPYQGNPNKILALVLFLILVFLSYTTLVSMMARILQNPGICSMHIEAKNNPFIFGKGSRDVCVWRVALDILNVNYCKQIKDSYVDYPSNSLKDSCIRNIAEDLGDTNMCYQIKDETMRQSCFWVIPEMQKIKNQ